MIEWKSISNHGVGYVSRLGRDPFSIEVLWYSNLPSNNDGAHWKAVVFGEKLAAWHHTSDDAKRYAETVAIRRLTLALHKFTKAG